MTDMKIVMASSIGSSTSITNGRTQTSFSRVVRPVLCFSTGSQTNMTIKLSDCVWTRRTAGVWD